MTTPECREIRRELDEVRVGARLSASTMQHLQGCAECQDFHQKETKLRQLVGSLGTVEAPADFDLQLRRRLASKGNGSAYRFPLALWPVAWRALTVGVAAVLMFAAFMLGRNMLAPKLSDPKVTQATSPKEQTPAAPPAIQKETSVKDPEKIVAVEQSPRQRGPIRVAGSKPRPPLVTRDLSSTPAPIFNSDQSFEAAPFTISASQQSLRLSLDDGSGVRTISVPRVTFGSQRVLTSTNASNQFAPKGVW